MSTVTDVPRAEFIENSLEPATPEPRRRIKRKTVNTIIWFVALAAITAIVLYPLVWLVFVSLAALAPAASTSISALSFLTGHWRGALPNGRIAEEVCTTAEGGVLLSAGREFQQGKCVFFDLVVFAEREGSLVLTPHPMGRKSEHDFPLVSIATDTPRVVFENLAHDFPQRFVYELVAPDHLRISLTGVIKGKTVTEVYDLSRAKDK